MVHDGKDVRTWPSFAVGRILDHHADPYKVDILEGYGEVSDGVDLDGVVACCSKGDLDLERIRVVAEDSRMDVATCGSLDGQVGMVMARGEMDGWGRPCACVEVEDFENG